MRDSDRYLAEDKADHRDPKLCHRRGCHYVISVTQGRHAGSCQLLEAHVPWRGYIMHGNNALSLRYRIHSAAKKEKPARA